MCVVTFDWAENDAVEKVRSFHARKGLAWAIIEVTDACNLNCIWCYANAGFASRRPKNHMNPERLGGLLKRLADAGVRQVTVSGGEPTVYPHIADTIRTAKDLGFVVHMNTNGVLFTKSMASELRRAGLSQIQTNIDSICPERHDRIRGLHGSFESGVRALRNAIESGMTAVSQTVLTRMNEDEIFSIFAFARGLGVHRCRVWDMTPSDGTARSNMHLSPSNYVKTLESLYEFGMSTGLRSIESGESLFPLDRKLGVPVTGGFCVSRFGACTTVGPDGSVFYCATHRKKLYNAFDVDGSLDDFHKLKLSEYVSAMSVPEPCSECSFVGRCAGGCIVRGNARQEAGLARCHLEKPMLSSL